MDASRIAEALRATAMFGGLPEDRLRRIAARVTVVSAAKDQVLFLAGEPARGMYVVVIGGVRATRATGDGREQVIHVEGPGATFAEVPMFDGGDYPSTVTAEADSVLLFLPREDVRTLCLESPEIALAALKVLAGRLRQTAALVEDLGLRDVDRRLARLIEDLAQERGIRRDGGVAVDLGMTQQQVAARIGSVREVVSRAFSRLQKAGLIETQGSRVRVPDLDKLAAYCRK